MDELLILFGFLTMLGFGLSNSFSRIPARNLQTDKYMFFEGAIKIFLYVIIMIIFSQNFLFKLTDYIFPLLAGIFGYLGFFFFIKGISKENIGVVVPISQSYPIILVFVGVFIFNEILKLEQILSIIISIFGIILISLNSGIFKKKGLDLFKKSGIYFAFLAALSWSFQATFLKMCIIGFFLTAFISEIVIFFIATLKLIYKKQFKSMKLPKKKISVFIFLSGITQVIGFICLVKGILINLSITSIFASASPVISVLYGKFIYKEKIGFKNNFAVILIITGILLLSYFS
jgi:uncharacterized membrane protein